MRWLALLNGTKTLIITAHSGNGTSGMQVAQNVNQ